MSFSGRHPDANADRGGSDRDTDLELYEASSLGALHSHPVGRVGARLDRAERAINRRRDEIRDWLVAREGEAAVRRLR